MEYKIILQETPGNKMDKILNDLHNSAGNWTIISNYTEANKARSTKMLRYWKWRRFIECSINKQSG